MDTLWMLQGKYNQSPIILVDTVAKDFFGMNTRTFLRKVDDGSIDLPVMRMDDSQKALKGVHIRTLAEYIDKRQAEAQRDHERMHH